MGKSWRNLKIHKKRLNLCQCGCGREVKEGRRFIKGHQNKGRHLTEEHKRKIAKSLKGHNVSEETRNKLSVANKGKKNCLGYKQSEEHKKKISESNKGKHNALGHKCSEKTKERLSKNVRGSKHPNFKHGKKYILGKHLRYKKQECFFGCKDAKRYDLHHEPPIDNILEWEGQLINLCHSCHMKVHHNILKLPDNVGVEWTKKDTERILGN